jgi:hypothetical protein
MNLLSDTQISCCFLLMTWNLFPRIQRMDVMLKIWERVSSLSKSKPRGIFSKSTWTISSWWSTYCQICLWSSLTKDVIMDKLLSQGHSACIHLSKCIKSDQRSSHHSRFYVVVEHTSLLWGPPVSFCLRGTSSGYSWGLSLLFTNESLFQVVII